MRRRCWKNRSTNPNDDRKSEDLKHEIRKPRYITDFRISIFLFRILVQFHGNDHLEGGDINLEHSFVVEVFHLVGSFHFSHFCAKIAATDILITFTWFKDRLNTNNTFTFYFTMCAIAIEYLPVTSM